MKNFATLALLFFLFGCGDNSPTKSRFENEIAFIGDFHFAAVNSFAREFTEEHFEPEEVVNIAVSGSPSQQWLPGNLYNKQGVVDAKPRSAFFITGTIDGLILPNPTSVKTYRRNVEKIARQFLADGAGTLHLTTPPPLGLRFSQARRDRVDDYAVAMLSVCEEVDGAECGPDLNLLIDPAIHLGDGIHLNAAGREIAVDAMEEVLGL